MTIRIGTSERDGTFYNQGRALKTLFERRGALAAVEVLESQAASTENANRLHAGEIEFGFMASNWIGRAMSGEAPFVEPIDLRMAAPMNAGPLFFIARADAANRRGGTCDEEQRPGIHRHRHAQIDRLDERDLAVPGAADPIRGHEAELDLAIRKAPRIVDARGFRFQHLDRRESRVPIEDRLERAALAVEGAVALRCADAQRHAWIESRSKGSGFAPLILRWRMSFSENR